jgi:hypothetical protein
VEEEVKRLNRLLFIKKSCFLIILLSVWGTFGVVKGVLGLRGGVGG